MTELDYIKKLSKIGELLISEKHCTLRMPSLFGKPIEFHAFSIMQDEIAEPGILLKFLKRLDFLSAMELKKQAIELEIICELKMEQLPLINSGKHY